MPKGQAFMTCTAPNGYNVSYIRILSFVAHGFLTRAALAGLIESLAAGVVNGRSGVPAACGHVGSLFAGPSPSAGSLDDHRGRSPRAPVTWGDRGL